MELLGWPRAGIAGITSVLGCAPLLRMLRAPAELTWQRMSSKDRHFVHLSLLTLPYPFINTPVRPASFVFLQVHLPLPGRSQALCLGGLPGPVWGLLGLQFALPRVGQGQAQAAGAPAGGGDYGAQSAVAGMGEDLPILLEGSCFKTVWGWRSSPVK